MNSLKKYLGIIWVLLAPAVIYFLVSSAMDNMITYPKAPKSCEKGLCV
jgi:ABC-type polysaccharide/polyol phosphate export permease